MTRTIVLVYKYACKGHSLFRLGLLCNLRTLNLPLEPSSLLSKLLPLHCPLALRIEDSSKPAT
jgi:hypothetical protein